MKKDVKEELYNYVKKFGKRHLIVCGECIYQTDSIQSKLEEFMEECYNIAGYHEEE